MSDLAVQIFEREGRFRKRWVLKATCEYEGFPEVLAELYDDPTELWRVQRKHRYDFIEHWKAWGDARPESQRVEFVGRQSMPPPPPRPDPDAPEIQLAVLEIPDCVPDNIMDLPRRTPRGWPYWAEAEEED